MMVSRFISGRMRPCLDSSCRDAGSGVFCLSVLDGVAGRGFSLPLVAWSLGRSGVPLQLLVLVVHFAGLTLAWKVWSYSAERSLARAFISAGGPLLAAGVRFGGSSARFKRCDRLDSSILVSSRQSVV